MDAAIALIVARGGQTIGVEIVVQHAAGEQVLAAPQADIADHIEFSRGNAVVDPLGLGLYFFRRGIRLLTQLHRTAGCQNEFSLVVFGADFDAIRLDRQSALFGDDIAAVNHRAGFFIGLDRAGIDAYGLVHVAPPGMRYGHDRQPQQKMNSHQQDLRSKLA